MKTPTKSQLKLARQCKWAISQLERTIAMWEEQMSQHPESKFWAEQIETKKAILADIKNTGTLRAL